MTWVLTSWLDLFGQGASKIHLTHFLCVRVIEVQGNAGVFVCFLWVLRILGLDLSSCVADILLFLQSNFKYLIFIVHYHAQ